MNTDPDQLLYYFVITQSKFPLLTVISKGYSADITKEIIQLIMYLLNGVGGGKHDHVKGLHHFRVALFCH